MDSIRYYLLVRFYSLFTTFFIFPAKHCVVNFIEKLYKADFELKPKGDGGIIFLDIILSGPVGVIIDGATKGSKVLNPHFIDVPSAIDGKPEKEWRSKSKLKHMQNRKINKSKNKTTRVY